MNARRKQIRIELNIKWTVLYLATAGVCIYIIAGGLH